MDNLGQFVVLWRKGSRVLAVGQLMVRQDGKVIHSVPSNMQCPTPTFCQLSHMQAANSSSSMSCTGYIVLPLLLLLLLPGKCSSLLTQCSAPCEPNSASLQGMFTFQTIIGFFTKSFHHICPTYDISLLYPRCV